LKNWKIRLLAMGTLLVVIGVLIFFFLSPGARTRKISRLQNQADRAIAAGNFVDAEVALRRALETAPEDPELLYRLGTVLEREGILDQARDSFLSAAKARKSPEPGYSAGMVSLKLNQREEAEKFFRDNNQNWPEHLPTLYQLGAILANKGRCAEAVKIFEKIVQLKPAEAEAYNNLGFCYYTLGELEKARASLQKALELRPGFEAANKSLETVEADLQGKPQAGTTAKEKACKTCK
jgi:Flp pilus assembly protein TadD